MDCRRHILFKMTCHFTSNLLMTKMIWTKKMMMMERMAIWQATMIRKWQLIKINKTLMVQTMAMGTTSRSIKEIESKITMSYNRMMGMNINSLAKTTKMVKI